MGQLEPLEHTAAGLEGTPPCPVCVLMQKSVLGASKSLDEALLRLRAEDVGSMMALLVTTMMETLPTQDARNAFLDAFAHQVTELTQGDVAMLSVPIPADAPTKGEIN